MWYFNILLPLFCYSCVWSDFFSGVLDRHNNIGYNLFREIVSILHLSGGDSDMKIIKMNRQNRTDINKANQPFEIIGKIKPMFYNGKWIYTEELYEKPCIKEYPDENFDCDLYIDDPEKAVYFAYSDTECVGQIVLKKDWNKYAFIEDICVAGAVRGQGIGTKLIETAAKWAEGSGLAGLALETQDNNLLACRFYAKCGFAIGSVDTMLYRNFNSDEFAVFWYRN